MEKELVTPLRQKLSDTESRLKDTASRLQRSEQLYQVDI